jgi:hypothetical protein
MQLNWKMRLDRKSAALAAAIAGISFAAVARATTFSTTEFEGAQIENDGAFEDDGGQFLELRGSTNKFADFGILDFNSSALGIPAGQQVTGVNPTMNLTLHVDNFDDPTQNQTLSFFLATDANPAEVQSGSTALAWEPNSTFAGGLNSPGQPGSFAAGTQLFSLGTATYITGQPDATALPVSFNLNTAEQQAIQQQVNTGGAVRLVVTTSETDGGFSSFYGYANSTTADIAKLSLDLNTGVGTSNTSKLYVNTPGTKTASINVGTALGDHGGQFCVLQGGSAISTVMLGNSNTVTGDTLNYTLSSTNASGSVTSPGPDPIASGGTAQATVGFTKADTALEAGNAITGSVTITNISNVATDPTPVTVNINSTLVLQERFVDTLGGSTNSPSSAPNVGKVLVGTTGSVTASITTDNPVNLSDFTNDALTTVTLNPNQTSAPFVQDDIFTKQPVATLTATSPNGTVGTTFDDTESENVTGHVAVMVSGIYGNNTPVTENGVTQNYTADFANFGQANITGDGLPGENDSMDVYMQWQGYQAASVTGNAFPSSPLVVVPNSTATATLTNAATNDNIFMTNNNGLRAGAVVTNTSSFDQTWSSGGWTLTGFANNSAILGSQSVGDANSHSISATVGFNASSQMINGTYGETIIVDLENEQDIQGATQNDLAPVVFNLQTTVNDANGTGAGTYTLNGGTLVAGATHLTGSFTQSGGRSTFTNITGTGQLAINGGSVTLAFGGGDSSVSSLSISGSGLLDITNNSAIINYAAGTQAATDASIRGYLVSGYAGGTLTGTTGITSSTAAVTPGFAVGYADGADGVVAGLSSGQIELKYTRYGDANLDGVVSGDDFTILVGNLGKSVSRWDQGDFNYDGVVSGDDFTLLVGNLGKAANGADITLPAADLAAIDAFAAANGLTLPSVPEPASMGILALSGIAMLSRRTRRAN